MSSSSLIAAADAGWKLVFDRAVIIRHRDPKWYFCTESATRLWREMAGSGLEAAKCLARHRPFVSRLVHWGLLAEGLRPDFPPGGSHQAGDPMIFRFSHLSAILRQFLPNPESVTTSRLRGEAVLQLADGRRYRHFRLDPNGSYLWALLREQPRSLAQLTELLASRGSAAPERVQAKTASFLRTLKENRLVRPVETTAPVGTHQPRRDRRRRVPPTRVRPQRSDGDVLDMRGLMICESVPLDRLEPTHSVR